MNKDDPAVQERLKKYISTPSHEKTSLFLAHPKRAKYIQGMYNKMCEECKPRVYVEVRKGTFKVDNELSFFCEDCKVSLLPLLEKIQAKCERLYG